MKNILVAADLSRESLGFGAGRQSLASERHIEQATPRLDTVQQMLALD
ncbi:hypothetical protein IVB12_23040 [Bradyrhizobium sp. 179]|nr:hypothetical protein [Bradyrhizobium sp. 179]MCK1544746.1 hypothetical protein [Bradyrhizobium sp. 179]